MRHRPHVTFGVGVASLNLLFFQFSLLPRRILLPHHVSWPISEVEAATHGFRGVATLNERQALADPAPTLLDPMVGEPLAYVQGSRLKSLAAAPWCEGYPDFFTLLHDLLLSGYLQDHPSSLPECNSLFAVGRL